ncbi:unnamed protein product [Dracunculus medinensis]|uniref:Clc-like protein n=1 Tax=Dracunculus medinensis TaxID=318479 RepID=A0A0N4UQB8_DRAME|nr:unnamed protein product [Dracunculus medinensis]
MFCDWTSRLLKAQVAAFFLICFSNLFMFIALITPAWQVAFDKDANRYVQSGLWIYCPGEAACWYIFSDNLINYYEKVDVCRFFLIGDCRKKLVRTPYFFNWHYVVLIIIIIALLFSSVAVLSLFLIVLLSIALAIFMVNAEMLESRYLIGIKNTFRKEYGYSYYLAGLGLIMFLFTLLAAIVITTFAIFGSNQNIKWQNNRLYTRPNSKHPPRPGSIIDTSSITPLPQPEYLQSTRTFLSY